MSCLSVPIASRNVAETQDADVCIMVCPYLWAKYTLIYTHCSGADEVSWESWELITVIHVESDVLRLFERQTLLRLQLLSLSGYLQSVVVKISLQFHRYLCVFMYFFVWNALQVLNQDDTPLLYSLVFGEGVVNDATSVVLFRAVQNYNFDAYTAVEALDVGGNFLYLFFTSTVFGVSVNHFLFTSDTCSNWSSLQYLT
jgi:hypothetical protein